MKSVSPVDRPALAQGSQNEAKIRSALPFFLAKHGLAVLQSHQFGLFLEKARPHIACSVDDIIIVYDKQRKLTYPIVVEYKTATNASTVQGVHKLNASTVQGVHDDDHSGV